MHGPARVDVDAMGHGKGQIVVGTWLIQLSPEKQVTPNPGVDQTWKNVAPASVTERLNATNFP